MIEELSNHSRLLLVGDNMGSPEYYSLWRVFGCGERRAASSLVEGARSDGW